MIMDTFAERFKELRLSKNMSARELARELGVSNTAIHRWEKGLRYPSLEYLVAIAKYFNVTTDYLCGLED